MQPGWRFELLSVLIGLCSCITTPSSLLNVNPPADTTEFFEGFDGTPSRPSQLPSDRWDASIYVRSGEDVREFPLMLAQHGADCSPPLHTHFVATHADAVFLCNNHLMTAISASGYGVIYLTPNHMIDFSACEATIQFDLSTLRASPRD
jgi:hypothetical protein